jgi:hypothetical protein
MNRLQPAKGQEWEERAAYALDFGIQPNKGSHFQFNTKQAKRKQQEMFLICIFMLYG